MDAQALSAFRYQGDCMAAEFEWNDAADEQALLAGVTSDLQQFGWEVRAIPPDLEKGTSGPFMIERGAVNYMVRDVHCVASFRTGVFYGMKGEAAR